MTVRRVKGLAHGIDARHHRRCRQWINFLNSALGVAADPVASLGRERRLAHLQASRIWIPIRMILQRTTCTFKFARISSRLSCWGTDAGVSKCKYWTQTQQESFS